MKRIYLMLLILLLGYLPVIVYAETCDSASIKIESIVLSDTRGNIEEKNTPTSSDNNLNIDLNMNVPGDSIEYKVTLKNTSDENYYFDESSLKKNSDYVEYEFVYPDGDNVVKSGQEKEIILKVTYINRANTANVIDNNVVTFNLTNTNLIIDVPDTLRVTFIALAVLALVASIILFVFVGKKKVSLLLVLVSVGVIAIYPLITNALCKCEVIVNSQVEIDGKEAKFLPGKEVNAKMKALAGDDLTIVTNGYSFSDEAIYNVRHSEVEPIDSNKEDKNIVSTSDSPYPIYMWFNTDTIYWWSEDETPSLNVDSSNMFFYLNKLVDISGLELFDASETENIKSMFYSSSIQNVNSLSKWNTSKVTTMRDTFFYAKSLQNVEGLKNWDVSNVEDLYRVFANNSSLVSLSGLEDWNVGKVKDMGYLFALCKELLDISALSKWNTSSVENFDSFFSGCRKLVDVSPIKNWNVSKVVSMKSMFNTCFSIEEIDLSKWDTQSLEIVSSMFAMGYLSDGTTGGSIKRILLSDKFDTSKVTDMSYMFYNNRVIEDYSFIRLINTSNVKIMTSMFYGNFNLTDLSYFKDWDVSKVENMEGTFTYNENIQSLDGLENWDVSRVESMGYMFSHSPLLEDASALNDWNVVNVTDFSRMFFQTQTHPEFTKLQGTWNNGTFTPA